MSLNKMIKGDMRFVASDWIPRYLSEPGVYICLYKDGSPDDWDCPSILQTTSTGSGYTWPPLALAAWPKWVPIERELSEEEVAAILAARKPSSEVSTE